MLLGDRFDNMNKVRKLNAPVLFIHGRNDDVIPFWHSQVRVFLPVTRFGIVSGNSAILEQGEKLTPTVCVLICQCLGTFQTSLDNC